MARSQYVYIVMKWTSKGTNIVASFTVKYEMITYLKKIESRKVLQVWRTVGNTDVKEVTETIMEEVEKELAEDEIEKCSNCHEPLNSECACMRNRCIKCEGPVGNITFSYCDKCWDKK